MKYCFGIDVGGTTIKLGLFTVEGGLLDKWEIKTIIENAGEQILPDIAASIREKISEKKLLEEELEKLTGFPCVIGNDANVAALGEMWKGAGEGEKDLIMITLGTGVGGGIIIDGIPINGAHGAGGEIGHMTVRNDETEYCGCGRKGCLEQYASATGAVRLAKRYLKESKKSTVLNEDGITAKDIFDAAKKGDEVATHIVEKFCMYLGQALVNLAATVDPAVFVIGGGVSKAGEILLGTAKSYFYEHTFYGNKKTKIMLATLGNDAGIYGAAKQVIH